MAKSTFQQIILTLQQFWADHGCLIAQPYYTQVGAGTMNPATFLRVLGPEPWNVAYVEPSVRPDDGRYGENPNRYQLHTQYQVILKPDPGNPQELYLDSLKAIGIDPRKHDIRFVEDNWEQPAISAWGLGWEVWLDGQEIAQFTYFQQMGGLTLDPVSVELTYGLERMLIALNNANSIWDEPYGANVSYGEIRRREEFEHSKHYFETANVERVRAMYDLFSAEAEACLAEGLILPAHDYLLKCSHAFNILDTRGAISVAERQAFFKRMRGLARGVAEAYVEQRKQLNYPLLRETQPKAAVQAPLPVSVSEPSDFLLEIGVEELPAQDTSTGIESLRSFIREGSPGCARTIARGSQGLRHAAAPGLAGIGSRAARAGQPSRGQGPAGIGRLRQLRAGPRRRCSVGSASTRSSSRMRNSRGENLVREMDGGRYVTWRKGTLGAATATLLSSLLPEVLSKIKFEKSMRWNESGVAFSRPIRWIVALYGEAVIPFEYAGVTSGNVTRGLRPNDSPSIEILAASQYVGRNAAGGHRARPQGTEGLDRGAGEAGGVLCGRRSAAPGRPRGRGHQPGREANGGARQLQPGIPAAAARRPDLGHEETPALLPD